MTNSNTHREEPLSRRQFVSTIGMVPAFQGVPSRENGRSSIAPNPTKKWQFDVPDGSAAVTQAVTDETVLVGTLAGHLHSLSTASGKEQWRFSTDGDEPLATPETIGERFTYVADETGTVYAIDLERGTTTWRFHENGLESRAFLALEDETVYVMGDSLTALSAGDGVTQWAVDPEVDLYPNPVVNGDVVCVGTWTDETVAYAVDDGSEVWRFERPEDQTGRAELYPIGRAETAGQSRTTAGGPVLVWDRVAGHLYGVEPNTGTERWRFALPGGDFTLRSTLEDGTIYALDGASVVAISATSGSERWRFTTDAPLEHRPVVADGSVYVGDATAIYSLSTNDGRLHWKTSIGDGEGRAFGPILNDAFVFDDSGITRAVATDDGSLWWTFDHGSDVPFTPLVADDAVLLGTESGSVYALSSPSETAVNQLRRGAANADRTVVGGVLTVGVFGGALLAAGVRKVRSGTSGPEYTE